MRLVKGGPYRRLILELAGEMEKMDEKGPSGSALWTAKQHTAFLDLQEIQKISRD